MMRIRSMYLVREITLSLVFASLPVASVCADPADGPVIRIDDVSRFYSIYDAAAGHPTADQLQHEYLDLGSEGLHTFAKVRNITGANMEAAMTKTPAIYSDAKRCAAVLPAVGQRLKGAMDKLSGLYPAARFLPVTIAVGRGRPVAAGGPTHGVMVGLEALCGVQFFDTNLEDRFVHVIAHEYIHVQQPESLGNNEHPTVLQVSLIEGTGEFLGEMISGGVANPGVRAEAKGRERDIETLFVADENKTDLSNWLFNGTLEKPGDLGYWVGYRIVKSYYLHAVDKRRAIHDILEMTDPKAFLAKSGWQPGINLD